jgi:TetR/AcrR family transcriptional regulator
VRKRDRVASQAKLLAAAEAEFVRKGPFAGSVNIIARQAGVNKRMIYHYFGSKEGIYEAVLRQNFAKVAPVFADTFAETTDEVEVLRLVVRRYCTFLRDNPSYVKLLAWEECAGGEQLAKVMPVALAEGFAGIRQIHEKAKAAGRFRADVDPNLLILSVNGLCFQPFSRPKVVEAMVQGEGTFERLVEHIIALLLDGVRVHRA